MKINPIVHLVKTNPIKPNSNPTCSELVEPIAKPLAASKPKRPKSAKMAQRLAIRGLSTVRVESIKKPMKKPNLLTIKMLSHSHPPVPATGTPFAHLDFVR